MTGHSTSVPDDDGDLDLVQRANAGDASAFEALYDRYRDWILRSARVVTANDDLAADVLQEVIVYWLKLFPGFVLQGKVTSFLYPCVRHIALEALRKRGRSMSLDGCDAERLSFADSGSMIQEEALQRAVAALPLEQREVLHLAVTEGLAMAEIARALEVPVGTVKSRLHHALAKLRHNELLRSSFFE